MSETLTHVQREYLADIYRLQYADYRPTLLPVSTNAIAEQLEVSPPAVWPPALLPPSPNSLSPSTTLPERLFSSPLSAALNGTTLQKTVTLHRVSATGSPAQKVKCPGH